MRDDQLTSAFKTRTDGAVRFTRRMAIELADLAGCEVKDLVLRLERMDLLHKGSWEWFQANGGFTRGHYEQARTDLRKQTGAA